MRRQPITMKYKLLVVFERIMKKKKRLLPTIKQNYKCLYVVQNLVQLHEVEEFMTHILYSSILSESQTLLTVHMICQQSHL